MSKTHSTAVKLGNKHKPLTESNWLCLFANIDVSWCIPPFYSPLPSIAVASGYVLLRSNGVKQ
jgi:hypothetical protein